MSEQWIVKSEQWIVGCRPEHSQTVILNIRKLSF